MNNYNHDAVNYVSLLFQNFADKFLVYSQVVISFCFTSLFNSPEIKKTKETPNCLLTFGSDYKIVNAFWLKFQKIDKYISSL